MNDKNFIEGLSQKREEYGVTQTRLAVACGISREYYNHIEKEKIPLTEELKEILKKRLEKALLTIMNILHMKGMAQTGRQLL